MSAKKKMMDAMRKSLGGGGTVTKAKSRKVEKDQNNNNDHDDDDDQQLTTLSPERQTIILDNSFYSVLRAYLPKKATGLSQPLEIHLLLSSLESNQKKRNTKNRNKKNNNNSPALQEISEEDPLQNVLKVENISFILRDTAVLRRIFLDCGNVVHIEFSTPLKDAALIHFDAPAAVKKALHLAFVDPESLNEALSLSNIQFGLEKWSKEEELEIQVPEEVLTKEILAYMTVFDKRVKEEKERKKVASTEPDEEGFVLVTTKKAAGANRAKGMDIETSASLKPKDRSISNFYKFQKKEAKREHLIQLQQKFEEDKKKIAEMKKHRKFYLNP